MQRLILDAEAGRLSEELARRGISGSTRIRAVIEVVAPEELPVAALAQEGGAFKFLADEPELYTDDDLIDRNR